MATKKESAKQVHTANVPVTKQPTPCQLQDCLNLTELAYVLGKAIGHPLTVMQIVGAIRALAFKNDTRKYATMSRGCLIIRQQTMLHHTKMKQLQEYLEERYAK